MSAKPSTAWDGVERRGVTNLDELQWALHKHTSEEMDRYKDIMDKQDQLENKMTHMEGVMEQMSKNVSAYIERSDVILNGIRRAFPKNEEGEPDFDGHRHDHQTRLKNAADHDKVMAYVKKQMEDEEVKGADRRFIMRALIITLCGSFALWAVTTLWQAAVVAPQAAQAAAAQK